MAGIFASAPILVFGKTGQLAIELQRRGGVIALGRDEADLLDPDACAAAIRAYAPRAVINAAAYTAVDAAESDEDTARVVNGDAPGAMARACADIGACFVHISTDYVFDGSGDASWRADQQTRPLSAYGRTKRIGEEAVAAAGATSVVIRTSWVFSAHGANFVKTMLRLGAERESLRIVADQIGGPTEAGDLAGAALAACAQLQADPATSGVYHFAGAPDVSWADFAREIFDQAGLAPAVNDIASSDYPTPAPRPKNSRMDCSTLATLGVARPDWRVSLRRVLTELGITQ